MPPIEYTPTILDNLLSLILQPLNALSFVLSIAILIVFHIIQRKVAAGTQERRLTYENFLPPAMDWEEKKTYYGKETRFAFDWIAPQIWCESRHVAADYKAFIENLNIYLKKTKGSCDYEFMRNKLERRLATLQEQSLKHIATPTSLGLLGTFIGVFLGIFFFLLGLINGNGVNDSAISSLLVGVLLSMATSIEGLIRSTFNNMRAAATQQIVDQRKNDFLDFLQTDITRNANASLMTAIGKLHDTVDRFEPAFSRVINSFETTFDRCTRNFGQAFERNVTAVSQAVEVMGNNMDKINHNIDLQQQLIHTLQTDTFAQGLEAFVNAGTAFTQLTSGLDKFEEARRIMLTVAQDTIELQQRQNETIEQYSAALRIPNEVAQRINDILQRISLFETNINIVGEKLAAREIFGNDLLDNIRQTVQAITEKQHIVEQFVDLENSQLRGYFAEQTEALRQLLDAFTQNYDEQASQFGAMLRAHNASLQNYHDTFETLLHKVFTPEELANDFAQLRQLHHLDLLPSMAQHISTLADDPMLGAVAGQQLLVAGEQRKLANEQLQATDQQLLKSDEQLQKSDQQLKLSDQQLQQLQQQREILSAQSTAITTQTRTLQQLLELLGKNTQQSEKNTEILRKINQHFQESSHRFSSSSQHSSPNP